jgi:phosphoglycerate kinase
MVKLPGISELGDVRGKRVIARVDFNVPLSPDRKVTDDRRITRALPTIGELLEKGARLVLMSHLGRPKGEPDDALRMDPAAECLSGHLGRPVKKLDDCIGEAVKAEVLGLSNGEVALLENLRFHEGEKKNDPAFGAALADLAELYVNDAFGTSHRAHASVVGVPAHLPGAAGHLLVEEVTTLTEIRDHPAAPLVVILGGAKVADKIPLIRNFLTKANHLVIGGGMAYTFLAAKGVGIGSSRLEADLVDEAKSILDTAAERGIEVHLPTDNVCAASIDDEDGAEVVAGDVPEGKMGLDIGPETAARFAEVVAKAKSVIWNGPMGVFEKPAFLSGTRTVGTAVADLGPDAQRVVGGGDTAAAAEVIGVADRVGHVSTGGGASLELLGGADLPGVVALLSGREG